ncbi:MAG: tRNA (adenosine(37)-N6)-dimethylallyltransferase MiaA [Bryobacteraceae bacterium]
MNSPGFPLVVVLGPTGSGKSDMALALAESVHGEIVNCDSVQVYRGLEIGAAKVPVSARRGIPHHLIDIIGPAEELTGGGYARLARQVLAQIGARGRIPIVVGGTGFYLRALLDGLSPAAGRDERLRARLTRIAARRPASLHRVLRARDPAAASRIHPNDRQKLIRALELTLLEGQPASLTQSRPRDALQGFTVIKLGLAPDRAALYDRLNRRTESMFRQGILREAAELPRGAKPLHALGYKQAFSVLQGISTLEEAIRECQTKTRQYAKRQMTWFRAEHGVVWLPGFGSDPEIQRRVISILTENNNHDV